MADNVNIIVQDTINDIVVNAAVVVETIDINVQVAVDEVQIIANPNNYIINVNRIIGEQVQSDWTQNDDEAPDYIKNKPTIPTATSDLTNDGEDGINPFITSADVTPQVNSDWDATSGVAEILNKPAIPTNTSDLTNDGEDGVNPFITAADIPASLLVALPFTTDHLTATNNAYVVGDVVWYLGNVYRCIANNDSILPTATAYWTNLGAGNPLVEQPTDWDSTSGNNQILNKPTLAAVATSGDYDDLTNKPTIPTNTSDLINDGEDGINPFITLADVPVPTNGLPVGGTAGQILTKIDSTDYNATWQENYADWTSQVKHTVKNNGLSGTITKGTAVYVTGSNGTNMLVGRASNVSEATSSKTMGLMQSDITTTGANQTGFVITEGLLGGLNTAGQTAGDPVWLGVNGALIYGLINKPYAPAHLVFIGIVTKISAGNGEIFVKVQNGFELKEIHDVDIITTTPINGHLLGYNGTLWVNKTIATWLGFTPVTDARTISTTAPLSGGGDLSANRTLSITQATTSTDGYLSSINWNTFNNKFTLPALTSGSVLFSNGTTIAQDNSNLFWDDTNNRLGIGTNAPNRNFVVYDGSAPHIQLATAASGLTASSGFQLRIVSNNVLFTNFQSSNMVFGNSGATHVTLFNSGNLLVSSTTTTDAGFRLDVNGTARVSGTTTITPAALTGTAATSVLDIAQTWNTTGAPTALKLNITDTASDFNSSNFIDFQIASTSNFSISKNGFISFGTQLSNVAKIYSGNSTTAASSARGVSLVMVGNTRANIGYDLFFVGGNRTTTSGVNGVLNITNGITPTSGTGEFSLLSLTSTINQTGGANGITRGLYINPTLTAAADFRAIEVANGITILGASTTAKASLRIPSGTAPTTPTNGDIWFDGTDLKMRIGGVTKTFTLI